MNDISVHPSGRLALSVGDDKTLFLWDLTKGKSAFKLRLPSEGLRVTWTPDGSKYAIMFQSCVTVYDGSNGSRIASTGIVSGRRFCDMVLLPDEALGHALACGEEGGAILLLPLDCSRSVDVAAGHAKRTRALAYCTGVKPSAVSGSDSAKAVSTALPMSAPSDASLNPISSIALAAKQITTLPCDGPFLVSADSEGIVKVWDAAALLAAVHSGAAPPTECVATLRAAAGSRITCLAASTCPVTAVPKPAKPAATAPVAASVTASAKPVVGQKRARAVDTVEAAAEVPRKSTAGASAAAGAGKPKAKVARSVEKPESVKEMSGERVTKTKAGSTAAAAAAASKKVSLKPKVRFQ